MITGLESGWHNETHDTLTLSDFANGIIRRLILTDYSNGLTKSELPALLNYKILQ